MKRETIRPEGITPTPAFFVPAVRVGETVEVVVLEVKTDKGKISLSRKAAFLTIATGPAKKFLPDGRNAHLIQEGPDYWLPLLMARWQLKHFQDIGPEMVCVMEARQ